MQVIRLALFLTIACAVLVGCDGPEQPKNGYSFRVIAALGDSADDGGVFTNTFDPYGINNNGDVVFLAELNLGAMSLPCLGCQGAYVSHNNRLEELARPGAMAPGGGVFTTSTNRISINENGDLAFGEGLEPEAAIAGRNAGLYRFSRRTGMTTVVARPGTPAPGGGAFDGAGGSPSLNNRAVIVFVGVIPSEVGPGRALHLGQGIFQADADDHLSAVLRPGDSAPNGGTFDWLSAPAINDAGDLVFTGHINSEPCIQFQMEVPPVPALFCAESVYARRAATGEIRSIAHIGDTAPGVATFSYAYPGGINTRGDIAFLGVVGAPGSGPAPPDNRGRDRPRSSTDYAASARASTLLRYRRAKYLQKASNRRLS